VTQVLDGGPGQSAGLAPGDELAAVDGYRVRSEADLRARLAARAPGAVVQLSVFRRDRLTPLELTLGAAPPNKLTIAAAAELTDAVRARFRAWLADEHPGAELSASGTNSAWL
jgi:predicted metalloprotease with PDZ domain